MLDEPTSALDISSTIDVVETLKSLTKSQNLTVLLAEHRIEKLLEVADTLTVVHGDGAAPQGPLRGENLDLLFNNHRMVPTVVEMSAFAKWQPTAITVAGAQQQWASKPLAEREPLQSVAESAELAALDALAEVKNVALTFADLNIEYAAPALLDCNLELRSGQITAIMGPNGSGKTTLLWAAIGELDSGAKLTGTIEPNFKKLRPENRLNKIALVPQRASDLLFLSTVSEELAESDRLSQLAPGSTAEVLRQIAGRLDPRQHPRDLSAGQQLALVIALQLAKDAPILLLDEPTRGLDYVAKRALADQLANLKLRQKTVVIASHDIEFVASLADRVVVLADGRVTHDGTADKVLGGGGPLQSAVASVVGGQQPPINLTQLRARYFGGEA